ncbi:MAG: toprim domain-containing protein [Thermoplasmata archaeon]|nr:MAG: toprim domain-containing protein [Thermoplasmata archaeon]KAA0014874.1 MAG: toprim domain-containing protein [Thermoplasmata archaeon]OYT62093.1 MAG: topoisomerase [Thermoplasmatales archaeon ex4484_30]
MDCRSAIEHIEKAIEEIKQKNKEIPIIVEGEKDVEALHRLGINGEILIVHCGKKIANFCDIIASKYKEIIILTDWDKKGWRLCKKIEENLKGRTKCFTEYRLIFARYSMVKDIEGIPSFMIHLKERARVNSK